MTTEEFSNEFDVLINSYSRYKDFDNKEILDSIEFNEYEKSLFLTQAQEDLVREFYNGKNIFYDSFEKTEEVRRYLSSLIRTNQIDECTNACVHDKISQDSKIFILPSDIWFITYEQVIFNDTTLGCLDSSTGGVIPISQDNYYRISRNPFRRPGKTRVLRLDIDGNAIEIISKYGISKYVVRYIAQPSPIILESLPNNLSINGVNMKTDCSLHIALHKMVLERAVQKALKSKIINNPS